MKTQKSESAKKNSNDMKSIYILADMEGITGIRNRQQVLPKSPDYEEGRHLMMEEINAAVDGAFKGGAKRVTVCDTHSSGAQIRLENMDPRAEYEAPNLGLIMPSLNESFDGVVLLGHHAMAGTADAFLDHTMSSREWFCFRINGRETGEIGIEASWAGHYGVPVIAVTGDRTACAEAKTFLGDVVTAEVKQAIGNAQARCVSCRTGHELVKDAVAEAATRCRKFDAFCPELPATVQLTFQRTDLADAVVSRPGISRVDGRTVQWTATSCLEICIL